MAGVYTTEGLVLYERTFTSKVIEGILDDWPEVDPTTDSRYQSYELTFDHLSRTDSSVKDRPSRYRKRYGKKKSLPIYDFDSWESDSSDISWMWNCKTCPGCERRHGVCGLCHGAHKAVECEKHLSSLNKGEKGDQKQ